MLGALVVHAYKNGFFCSLPSTYYQLQHAQTATVPYQDTGLKPILYAEMNGNTLANKAQIQLFSKPVDINFSLDDYVTKWRKFDNKSQMNNIERRSMPLDEETSAIIFTYVRVQHTLSFEAFFIRENTLFVVVITDSLKIHRRDNFQKECMRFLASIVFKPELKSVVDKEFGGKLIQHVYS